MAVLEQVRRLLRDAAPGHRAGRVGRIDGPRHAVAHAQRAARKVGEGRAERGDAAHGLVPQDGRRLLHAAAGVSAQVAAAERGILVAHQDFAFARREKRVLLEAQGDARPAGHLRTDGPETGARNSVSTPSAPSATLPPATPASLQAWLNS